MSSLIKRLVRDDESTATKKPLVVDNDSDTEEDMNSLYGVDFKRRKQSSNGANDKTWKSSQQSTTTASTTTAIKPTTTTTTASTTTSSATAKLIGISVASPTSNSKPTTDLRMPVYATRPSPRTCHLLQLSHKPSWANAIPFKLAFNGGAITNALITSYQIDIGWMLTEAPVLFDAKRITVVHHTPMDDNVRLTQLRVSMPNFRNNAHRQRDIHHTKVFFF